MKWSWRIARFAGIDVYLHWTFLLLLGWIGLMHYNSGGAGQAVLGVGMILAIFACVVLHEFGHALTARRFGVQTRDITLLPIGGVARLERIPEKPHQEFWIAVAGPAVNVVIAAVLFVLVLLLTDLSRIFPKALVGGSLLLTLLWVNVLLVAFNLLPAFPMDGGRVLRSLLAMRMDYVRATEIAARTGQFVAILFGVAGFFMQPVNPFLIFIALFVYLGAEAEAGVAQMKAGTRGVTVRDAMMTYFRSLPAPMTLDEAAEQLLAGSQQDFPVLEEDRLLGMLMREDLVRGLGEGGGKQPVTEFMTSDYCVADEREMLDAVLERLREHACSSAPVLRDGKLVGLLSMHNIGELIMIRSVRQARDIPAQARQMAGTG